MSQPRTKLRNPTQYHLMASQQHHHHKRFSQPTFPLTTVDQFDDPADSFAPPLHDFDDLDYNSEHQKTSSALSYASFAEDSPSENSLGGYGTDPYASSTSPPFHAFPGMKAYVGMKDVYRDEHQQHSMSIQRGSMAADPRQYPIATTSSPSSSISPWFPMSAPANIGLNELGTTMGHMNPAAVAAAAAAAAAATGPGPLAPQQFDAGARSLEDDYAVQMNLQLVMEKRRRRRESHNAVERRRRENLNERIQELGNLLPQSMLEDCVNNGGGGMNNKPNKGTILRKSVDYIKSLQQEHSAHRQRIQELETILRQVIQEGKTSQL